ncbi:MAG: Ribosome-binding factor A [Firmicutes bacterium]|nr:Ribosome-binding factor A [candidate division NPL-UPA2 bacterium]MBT9153745.1 Ribosome-binding factor A [candidate division NPL-UPA2 bacterium]
MSQYRRERIKMMLKEAISDIMRQMKDPRIGFASITSVELSGDLRHLKVFVSVLGTEEERAETHKALESASGYFRSEVGSRVELRFTPEIIFRLDDSLEHGAHINKLLKDIERGVK